MKPRIGVLTSGGDCPGLNAVLRGVVLAAEKLGWEVVGFRDGFEGLLPPGNHVILDRESINGIMALGGTIIGTTNRGHFVAKVGAGNRTIVPADIIAGAKNILDELQVKALIIVGGDGSMVSYQNYQVRQVPIAEAVNRLKLVPPNGEMVQTAPDVDISFGD
jgi:ATP-dependent phosphofructokinase / diphosphate-dependent phosphofructokinase